MTKYVIAHGEDPDGTEWYWFNYADGKQSPLYASFGDMASELAAKFNFQRQHNVRASIEFGPENGIIFLPQPGGGLFNLLMVPSLLCEQLWKAITDDDHEPAA